MVAPNSPSDMALKLAGPDSIIMTNNVDDPPAAPTIGGIINAMIVPGGYRIAGVFISARVVGAPVGAVRLDLDGVAVSGSTVTLVAADTVAQAVPIDGTDPVDTVGGELLEVILTAGVGTRDLTTTVLLKKLI